MKIKDLIKELQKLNEDSDVLLSSDEEQNTLFRDVRMIEYTEDKEVVLFGCSGSEVED